MKDRSDKVAEFIKQSEWLPNFTSVRFLAAGEYNENYKVDTAGRSYVFRINHGSQLGIKNQIAYEFAVLKALKNTGRTPYPLKYVDKCSEFENGALLMNFIEGNSFNYHRDYLKAAEAFMLIHTQQPVDSLMVQVNPIMDIADESLKLISRFKTHPLEREKKKLLIYHEKIRELGEINRDIFINETLCIVNTEVNSGNFIVSGKKAMLVDWEKAVTSYRYQDLGHFICPTTTLWKTDFVFGKKEKYSFLKKYFELSEEGIDFHEFTYKTELLVKTILLRALSWCFMAFFEYTSIERPLKNELTFKKIRNYLDEIESFI
jgi:aminoglycoside phosphotransferase (APT) family kinase protein